jgi:hypothetical protein
MMEENKNIDKETGACEENAPKKDKKCSKKDKSAELISKIAELETEVKLRDANTYTDQKLLDLYKYFDGENKEIRATICDMKAQQGVINANLTTGLDVLKSQVASTQAVVAGITRTAVPDNVICKFCNCCNGCSANI